MCPGMVSMHTQVVGADGPGRVGGTTDVPESRGRVNVWTCVVICYTANIRAVPFYAGPTHSVVGGRRNGMTTYK